MVAWWVVGSWGRVCQWPQGVSELEREPRYEKTEERGEESREHLTHRSESPVPAAQCFEPCRSPLEKRTGHGELAQVNGKAAGPGR